MAETRKKRVVSEETRKKMSEARKGVPHSEERRARMSEAHRGKKHSKKTRKKISEALKGRVVTEEAKRKIGAANAAKDHSYMKRERHPNAVRVNQLTPEGELVKTWNCMRDITDDPAFPSVHYLRKCCRGEMETYNGYRWEYADRK